MQLSLRSDARPRSDRANFPGESRQTPFAPRSQKPARPLGVPLWSPHDLRHRRISLLHLRGVPWARIGEFVGQRNLSVTANIYTHVLLDEAELEYGRLIAGTR